MKKIRYEIFLIFERFKGFSKKEIYLKLDKKVAISTIYHNYATWKKADRIVRELTKRW